MNESTIDWRDVPLVGRDRELARIDAVLRQSTHGGVVIAGEAGVGKTRLAREVVAGGAAAGCHVLRAFATTSTASVPFGVFGSFLDVGNPNRSQTEVLVWAAREIERVADSRSVLLVVDDAHLLDDGSASLVHHLVVTGQVRALVTVRSGVPAPDAVGALWKDDLLDRIDLLPLERPDIAEFGRVALGWPVDPATLSRLTDLSRGNPLWLRELLEAARESGGMRRVHGHVSWQGQLRVGARLDDLVRSRLGADSPGAQALTEYLAIAEPLELDLLETLLGAGALEEAEQRAVTSVWVDGNRRTVRLAHPLYAEVVRSALGAARTRRRARELIAAWTARRRHDDEFRLAQLHLLAGRVSDPALLVSASTRARGLADLDTAEGLARAAFLAGGGDVALLALGECLYWQGRYADLVDLLERETLEGAEPAARAHRSVLLAAAWFWGLGRADAAEQVFSDAIGEFDDGSAEWCDLLAHRCESRMFAGRFAESIDDAGEVLERSAAPVVARLNAFSGLVPSLALAGRVDDALEHAGTGIELMLSSEAGLDGAGSFVGHCLAQLLRGDLVDLEALVTSLYDDALSRPEDPLRGTWALLIGRAALGAGHLDVAVARLREGGALLHHHDPGRGLSWCLSSLAEALAMQGHGAEAHEVLVSAEAAQHPPVRCFDLELGLARAWTASALGKGELARKLATDTATEMITSGAFGAGALALFDAARLGAKGTTSCWPELLPKLQGPLFPVMASTAAALEVGEPSALLAASEAFEGIGANLWAAETAAEAALAFHRRDDQVGCERTRARCATLVDECGSPRTPLLFAAGARSGGRLTRREREVAQLAGAGLSNRAIAQQLGISRRTAENHLAHAFQKLGVASRAELGAASSATTAPAEGGWRPGPRD